MTTQATLPLNTLKIDPVNVRLIGRGMPDPELKASIQARGILQPLVVRPNGEGHQAYIGGRRLEQAQALAKDGAVAIDWPVPVIITNATDAEAREASLAENAHRKPMHPVDEYRAYAALHTDKEAPLDVDTLAEHFGLDRKHVQQRLALGALHEKVLDGWRDGLMNEQTAQAFTLCTDKKQQGKIFDALKKRGSLYAQTVKAELKIGQDNIGRLLDAVGADAYQARGGTVVLDLFGKDHQISDAALLRAMITEKLEAVAEQLRADGWSWTVTERPDDYHLYGEIEPKLKPTDDEKAERARLVAITQDDDADTTDADDAWDAINALDDKVALRSYTDKQKAEGGCFVVLEHGGEIAVHHGKTRPAPKKSARAAAGDDSAAPGEAAQPKPSESKELSHALAERLGNSLIRATKYALVIEAKQAKVHGVNLVVITTFANMVDDNAWRMPPDVRDALPQLRDLIDPEIMDAAIRKEFDAEDYFGNAPIPILLAAITEAVNPDEARKLKGKKKGELAKFALANVAKTAWLPKELRTANYGGPVKGKAKTTARKKK